VKASLSIDEIKGGHPVSQAALEDMMVMEYKMPKHLSFGMNLMSSKYDLVNDFDGSVRRMAEDKCARSFDTRRGLHLESVLNKVIAVNPHLRALPRGESDVSFVRKAGNPHTTIAADVKANFLTVNTNSIHATRRKLFDTLKTFPSSSRIEFAAILTNLELKKVSRKHTNGLWFINTCDTMCIVGNDYKFFDVWVNAVAASAPDTTQYNTILTKAEDKIYTRLDPFRTKNGFDYAAAMKAGL
jgi:hypothetical protein